jgi:outer membrane putative beta-barrel porin/alpha-amylase
VFSLAGFRVGVGCPKPVRTILDQQRDVSFVGPTTSLEGWFTGLEHMGAAAIALAVWAGAAGAQNSPSSESIAKELGPKTLLEGILGSSESDKAKERSGEEDHLDADRPHFPEATTTVGKGRAILESGYTFTKKGDSFLSHSAPEALLRVGMFADWFEFRIAQNFLHQRQTVEGETVTASGAQDLYLGVKLALTEQKGLLPAMVVIPQMTVRGGDRSQSASRRERRLRMGSDQGSLQHRASDREQFRSGRLGSRLAPRARHGAHGGVSADQES